MSKFVNGQRYDTDFFPIDDQGNRIGDKDLGASQTWTNANEPWRNTPGWHGQPLSAEQSAGLQQSNPAAWAAREQWQSQNPMWQSGIYSPSSTGTGSGTGTGTGGNNQYAFNWDGWNVGGGGGNQFGGGANQFNPQAGNTDWVSQYDGGNQGAMTNAARGVPGQLQAGAGVDFTGSPPQSSIIRQTGGFDPNGPQPTRLPPEGADTGIPTRNFPTRRPPEGADMGPPRTGYYNAPTLDSAALLSQLGQDTQSAIQRGLADPSVNPNDPVYRAQVEMNNRNLQRSTDRRRAAEAQRAHASGTLASGGFDSRVSGILEDQGNAEADFEAGLMQSELGAARERQARAMQLGAGLLSQEQQQDLQSRLANQGARLQTNALNNNRDLGMGQLDLGNRAMNNDMILRRNALLLQQQLGLSDLDLRRLGLTNQNSQYYAGLGQQLGLSQAAMNQQALLALLGG